MKVAINVVSLENKPAYNLILGMSHFIKTVEDVHELVATSVPEAKFGLAFCEASGPRKIRRSGTDKQLVKEAVRMATLIGAGHCFVLVLGNLYPVNILPRLKQVPEIVGLFCATANPVQALVVESAQGRGIIGVIDGSPPSGVESVAEVKERQQLLRTIGYKL